MSGTPRQFALDEARALTVLKWDLGDAPMADAPGPEENWSPDLPDGWRANYDDGTETASLIESALAAGVLVAPQGCKLVWQLEPDGDGDYYRWLLDIETPAPLIIGDHGTEMRWLGGGDDCRGVESAMNVLREAHRAGNDLLGQLANFVKAASQ
jgi:hypothetical protein